MLSMLKPRRDGSRHPIDKIRDSLAVVLVMFGLAVGGVSAHDLGYDSVDGCEIRYEESTKYDTERIHAQNLWESLKGSDNCVDIEPDVWNTITDLEWFDVNDSSVTWFGFYDPDPGADDILLNVYYMDDFNDCKRKHVTSHELGHAHRLDHTFDPNVMTEVSFPCTLGDHDIEDYESFWGPA